MINIEVISKAAPDLKGEGWVLRAMSKDWGKPRYFVASRAEAIVTGWEVLVFPSDEHGKVQDFSAVAGGRGKTHEEVIGQLKEVLEGKATYEPDTTPTEMVIEITQQLFCERDSEGK